MADSILNSVKKVLGLDDEYLVFDSDVILHINSVLSTLNQLGIGPENGYVVEDANTGLWSEFITDDSRLNSVKSYMYLRVRMLFDPPTTSFMLDAMSKQISEMEWRINTYRESYGWADPTIGQLGTPFNIKLGLPFTEQIRVRNGINVWATLDSFTIIFGLRETQDPNSRPIMSLTSYVTASYDGDDIVLVWSMSGVMTRALRDGYYSLVLSDIGSNPSRAIEVISGQLHTTG